MLWGSLFISSPLSNFIMEKSCWWGKSFLPCRQFWRISHKNSIKKQLWLRSAFRIYTRLFVSSVESLRSFLWLDAVVECCGGMLWWYEVVVRCGGMPRWYAVVVCCGGMLWWYAVGVCCGGMLWWYAVAEWCGGMLWRSALLKLESFGDFFEGQLMLDALTICSGATGMVWRSAMANCWGGMLSLLWPSVLEF